MPTSMAHCLAGVARAFVPGVSATTRAVMASQTFGDLRAAGRLTWGRLQIGRHRAQVRGDVDSVLLQRLQRHHLEHGDVGRRQHDVRRRSFTVRSGPVVGGHAPPVARHQTGESVVGHGRRQIVAIPRWCSRNSAVTTAQIVWLPRSWGPVVQQPSRKKPVNGAVLHTSSAPPRTLRSTMSHGPRSGRRGGEVECSSVGVAGSPEAVAGGREVRRGQSDLSVGMGETCNGERHLVTLTHARALTQSGLRFHLPPPPWTGGPFRRG